METNENENKILTTDDNAQFKSTDLNVITNITGKVEQNKIAYSNVNVICKEESGDKNLSNDANDVQITNDNTRTR